MEHFLRFAVVFALAVLANGIVLQQRLDRWRFSFQLGVLWGWEVTGKWPSSQVGGDKHPLRFVYKWIFVWGVITFSAGDPKNQLQPGEPLHFAWQFFGVESDDLQSKHLRGLVFITLKKRTCLFFQILCGYPGHMDRLWRQPVGTQVNLRPLSQSHASPSHPKAS